MARITKSKAEAVELDEEEGASAPSTEPEVLEAIVAPEAPKPEKQARFIPNCDSNPRIGGKDYQFKKDQETVAPYGVFELLREAKMIAVELRN